MFFFLKNLLIFLVFFLVNLSVLMHFVLGEHSGISEIAFYVACLFACSMQ